MLVQEFFTSLVIVLFVLIAEVLEGMTVERGRTAIKDMLNMIPKNVVVKRDGKTEEIEISEIDIVDLIIIKPGYFIPVDGEIISGHSFVNQSSKTGESLPVENISGSFVYAGTLNQSGLLEVKTQEVGKDTAYGKIIEAKVVFS